MLLVVPLMLAGQIASRAEAGQERPQQSADTTVVGCLHAGANSGEFVLVDDEKGAFQVQAAEGVDIAAHVGHRVELTGTVEKTESGMIVTAKALKMVSTSCTP
jgi:hypothetical protein